MISVGEALEIILSGIETLPSESVPILDMRGRTLAEAVAARRTQPPVDVSATDGYALRAADAARIPARLTCLGSVPKKGGAVAGRVSEGECVEVVAGGPLPPGADAVVPQDDVARDGARVVVKEPARSGDQVRPAGMDFTEGRVLLRPGRLLAPRDVALLAAMGIDQVSVTRRPRVAILSAADPLAPLDGSPGSSHFAAANAAGLAALVFSQVGDLVETGSGDLEHRLAAAQAADLLVIPGGGTAAMRAALRAHGFRPSVDSLAVRPGRTMVFGHLDALPVLALPGNPVSVGVISVLFVKPILQKMRGLPPSTGASGMARLGRDLAENGRHQTYLRADLYREPDGTLVANPFEKQDNAMLADFARADGLIVRPPFAPPTRAGDRVEIILL